MLGCFGRLTNASTHAQECGEGIGMVECQVCSNGSGGQRRKHADLVKCGVLLIVHCLTTVRLHGKWLPLLPHMPKGVEEVLG
jgi:hypothetical protein